MSGFEGLQTIRCLAYLLKGLPLKGPKHHTSFVLQVYFSCNTTKETTYVEGMERRMWECFQSKNEEIVGKTAEKLHSSFWRIKSARTYTVKNYYPRTVDFMKGIAKDSLPCSANALKTWAIATSYLIYLMMEEPHPAVSLSLSRINHWVTS